MSISSEEQRRLLARVGRLTTRRPDPPRDVRYKNGAVFWTPPADMSIVTHYCIRIDDDAADPSAVLSAGSRWTPVPSARMVFVSSLNFNNRLESARIKVNVTSNTSTGGSVTSIFVDLDPGASTTNITADDGVADALLVVKVKNNPTGEGLITWDTNFQANTPALIPEYPNGTARFLFWWDVDESVWAPLSQWLDS